MITMISRKAKQCGVSDYGLRLFDILKDYFDIRLAEVNNESELIDELNKSTVVLYNYHYATLPFLTDELLKNRRHIRHIAIFHEAALNFTPDEVVNTLPRPLFYETYETYENELPTIGSFGFGFPDKNYSGLANLVKEQFDKATLRLNIPFAEYGDSDGYLAKREASRVIDILKGTNIKVEINHDYLSHKEILNFLSRNDLNLFLYSQSLGRGISSSTDYALSVKKPIGVSSSEMFRHLPKEIIVDNITLPELIKNGITPLKQTYEDNSKDKLIEKYRTIFESK